MNPAKKWPLLLAILFLTAVICFFSLKSGLLYGIVKAVFVGLLYGVVFYFFAVSKIFGSQAQIELHRQDWIIFSGYANHFLNYEGVGGKLYLLKDKLHFVSHSVNLQNHEWQVAIDQIKEVCFYNVLGFVPNGLEVQTADGKTEKFVVNNRDAWQSAILTAKAVHI